MAAGKDSYVLLELRGESQWLSEALSAGGIAFYAVEHDHSVSGKKDTEVRFERSFPAMGPEVGFVAVATGSTAAITALAAVLREEVKIRRRKVLIRKADGSVLEVEGDLSVEEIERLIDAGATDQGSQ
ncbi:MAG TPA: hypothetical protein VFI03_12005 [Solirubrobacterales bacterium]|nr:hypothetical protein [Solirubrobacterales bacterium]